MYKTLLTSILVLFMSTIYYSQNINLDEYEIYLGDTLISKQDFMEHNKALSEEQAKILQFKPITDGLKKAYYLNGKLSSSGKMENLKENGIWEYWHPNGQKARKGEFINGKPNGQHEYWYQNGNPRAIGNWKNGVYEGKWEIYNEDGTQKIIKSYENGKEVLEKKSE
ncbi:toxin-antitoxin system YwqK family antitoxin [Chryseobacterium jejuense]|uniref:MORN repeat variant n=1 Tax=Chryseobacterium jejuense TaxID=445960 RepID=A0A2X2X2Q3_CHRJE|nr:hypothetical protein [Chryseobacterium jejuense]SDJ56153.1 MORN repeat variant [Chryseobacterium jejuense]SQB46197.1 MORN repeat variant [Chryseobacterium jejuense]